MTAPQIPNLRITWTCELCLATERSGASCTIVPRPGDEDDVPLCESCYSPRNDEIIRAGVIHEFPWGQPVWLHGAAQISEDGAYRYHLRRAWAHRTQSPSVLWVMLNPSTADASLNDQTIHRIMAFTARWGRAEIEVVNLFAFRTPHPHQIPRTYASAVGLDNDRTIAGAMARADVVIAAWGAPTLAWLAPMVSDRVAAVRAIAATTGRKLMALGTSSSGAPKHPLARGKHRIDDHAQPVPWSPR